MSLYFDYTLSHSFSGLDKDDSTDIKIFSTQNCDAHTLLPNNSTLIGITYRSYTIDAHRKDTGGRPIDYLNFYDSSDELLTTSTYYPRTNKTNSNFYTQTYKSYYHAYITIFVSTTVYGTVEHNVRYHYVPYNLNVSLDSPAAGDVIEYRIADGNNTVNLYASNIGAYTLDYWEINNQNAGSANPYLLSAADGETVNIIAHYKKKKYTVNYYSIDKNNTMNFIDSQTCEYGETYNYLTRPELTPNEGYGYTGWMSFNPYEETTSYYSVTSTTYTTYNSNTTSGAYYTIFSNLASEDGAIINRYICELPRRYTISYKNYQYLKNNYGYTTEYHYYNIDTTLKNLPAKNTSGYKFLNPSPNYWFSTDEDFTTDSETINIIPATYHSDITVYSYEIPINYTVYYHYYDISNSILNITQQECTYGITYTHPAKPTDQSYYYQAGWFEEDQSNNLENQYAKFIYDTDNETYNYVGLALDWSYANFNDNFSNLTTVDGNSVHFYTYYIPYGYRIQYHWLDDFGRGDPDFNPPQTQWYAYMREPLVEIQSIPDFEEYIVHNAGTKNWQYYDTNNELQTNELDYIPKTAHQEYNFYGEKDVKGRIITISSNNTELGTIEVITPIPNENTYQEGDIIQFRVKTIAPNCHFHKWNDRSHEFERTITVGSRNYNYIAEFHSNTEHIPGILGVYKGTTPISTIYKDTTCIYGGVN